MKGKRLTLFLFPLLLTAGPALRADEGMWLPSLISQRFPDMQAKGFKLTPEDIYSVNQACLKDAVVLFGSGCTGEVVSGEGLLFTNHHCGYGYIQRHSSVEHDYLRDGFWAMRRDEELPNPGLSVSFLDRMEDVTSRILSGYDPARMTEDQRDSVVRANSRSLTAQVQKEGKGIRASVEALYYGNQYYLFVFRVYRDVRLVGAPPSSIGKFGGDTDNWMWPRHTGDFSIFRIYADKDNEPADYSEDNVPYRPKRFLRICTSGVDVGDFTFVYGCPGSTNEYITSSEVRYIAEVSDPRKIALRTKRLDIQKKYMSADQKVRIQYSSKNASTANAWKKWQGEARGVAKMKTVGLKKLYEERFSKWAVGTRYEGVVDRINAVQGEREPYYLAYEYYNETVRNIEVVQFASSVAANLSSPSRIRELAGTFFKDYYRPIDEEIFEAMLTSFDAELPDAFKPAFFKEQVSRWGSVAAWRDEVYRTTMFTDRARVESLTEADSAAVHSDPAYLIFSSFYSWYQDELRPTIARTTRELRLMHRDYMQGQMDFEPGKAFYPDANLTLRVAYGKVGGYSPSDGITYKPVSTLRGIIEKDNPDIFDYNIPQTLRDIYAQGGHEDQPVCFLATNHTTGGNSGSPVLNAYGDLVGINFDRVWEGTMSDIVYDPEVCRNISLDVRYLLFNIKYIGHADYLLDEMEFVSR